MNQYRPILFNTEMVRAILEGRKTVTRRVVKKKSVDDVLSSPARIENPEVSDSRFIRCLCDPPFEPEDILWVRETWQVARGGGYMYRADTVRSHDLFITPDGRVVGDIPWRPSIHMPREAARIFLRVKEVTVERLQDCGNAQAKDEGCTCCSQFARVWGSTLKPTDRDHYGWEANPWVWVVRFERCIRSALWS